MNLVLTPLAIKVSQSAPNIRVFPVFDIQRVFSTTFQCSGGSHEKSTNKKCGYPGCGIKQLASSRPASQQPEVSWITPNCLNNMYIIGKNLDLKLDGGYLHICGFCMFLLDLKLAYHFTLQFTISGVIFTWRKISLSKFPWRRNPP